MHHYTALPSIFSYHDLAPNLDLPALLRKLSPPPRFAHTTLASYLPDPHHPTQAAAKAYLQNFVARLNRQQNGLGKLLKAFVPENIVGIYLNGGFGVGKTHLLAGVYQAFAGKKVYLSFTELMYLIGYLGLERASAELGAAQLICIDEFELDDPGNTTMALGFLQRVFAQGAVVVTTSNTPPSRLGEGRFAVQDFQREIAMLSAKFHVVRIDGPDYRLRHHASQSTHSTWHLQGLRRLFSDYHPAKLRKKAYFTGEELSHFLRQLHPMRYLEIAEMLDAVFLEHLAALTDQYDALRFVYFVDKLYDYQSKLFVADSVPIETLFPSDFYKSAYAKKYLRCLSRLREICEQAPA
ncbi:MAG: cell division protein ZapE [Chloroherpetonaceae bacterium]|nr:cell division protein ZapE [Chloroherpetonaceae bacterium]